MPSVLPPLLLEFSRCRRSAAQRVIIASYETVRQWWRKFGPKYARTLKRRQGRLGDTWYLDEVFITINGQRQLPQEMPP